MMLFSIPSRSAPISLVLGALVAAAALAGPSKGPGQWKAFRDPTVQDYGHQWSQVGDPHNDPFVYHDPFIFIPPRDMGRTNYKYRVMTREVTVGEWFEFVQEYAPYVTPTQAGAIGLVGPQGYIQFQGFSGGVPQYRMVEQFANLPMQASWRFVARYANFLHNNQADAAWAFESGVYDTSTFGQTQNDQGLNIYTDQQERSEGARFWIPSTDEWKKAGHWDPNRYGEDQGGWWQYPITSDAAPVPGDPELGGQTNAPIFPIGQDRPFDVGSYPDITSPWGLLDMSGGGHEWLEEFVRPDSPWLRYAAGSSIYTDPAAALIDALGALRWWAPFNFASVRLASVIPSPPSLIVLGGLCALFARRHR